MKVNGNSGGQMDEELSVALMERCDFSEGCPEQFVDLVLFGDSVHNPPYLGTGKGRH